MLATWPFYDVENGGGIWEFLEQFSELSELTDRIAGDRIDGSSRFSDRDQISDRSTLFIIDFFFLEMTYPHHRMVFKRAAIKD